MVLVLERKLSQTSLTRERLQELLDYDPKTGAFRWKVRRNAHGGPVYPGDTAGCIDRSNGYMKIGIDGRPYFAHRLAWLHVHGSWPSVEIDHINGDRRDNSIANLREATRSENARNTPRRADNSSGFRGVFWGAKQRRWYARINVKGVTYSLGGYATAEAAAAAFREAEKRLCGDFVRAA